MEIVADEIRAAVLYQHLIRIILPRPIAWVSTVSASGVTNLAPFSFFTGAGSRPPSLIFCPANRRDGSPKDTLRNIQANGEFVVNLVSSSMAELMNRTSAELSDEESEFLHFHVDSVPSVSVQPPRVLNSPASIECRLMQVIELESGPGGANIVIGRIEHIHLNDDVLDAQGFADHRQMDLIGRLGGSAYCFTGNSFELTRPE